MIQTEDFFHSLLFSLSCISSAESLAKFSLKMTFAENLWPLIAGSHILVQLSEHSNSELFFNFGLGFNRNCWLQHTPYYNHGYYLANTFDLCDKTPWKRVGSELGLNGNSPLLPYLGYISALWHVYDVKRHSSMVLNWFFCSISSLNESVKFIDLGHHPGVRNPSWSKIRSRFHKEAHLLA